MPCRPALCACFLFLAVRTASGAEPLPEAPRYAPIVLDAAQAGADVALLRRALETVHPGLTRYADGARIAAAFATLEALAREPITDIALWRETARMLAQIRCDHTKPEAPPSVAAWRRGHPTQLPLRFRLLEGRMIVVSNDGQAGAPPPGAEIVAVNGRPVPVVLATIAQAVARDGDTRDAVAAKLASDGDLAGDDFDEYWPAFYGFPTAWTLTWKVDGDLKASTSMLAPIGFAAWMALPWPGAAWHDEFYRAVRWRIAGDTAVLRVDTFVNYRNPVDATAFMAAFFKTLKAQHVEHLILDLRANAGGFDDAAIALARHLLPDGFVWEKPALLKAIRYGDLAAHLESWGDPDETFAVPESRFRRLANGDWERLPRPGEPADEAVTPQRAVADRFEGRLTVLAGPSNASGATMAIAQLHERLGARVVGEDTSGSAEGPTAGRLLLLHLPASGIAVRIPNAWDRVAIERFVPRLGVAADVHVESTAADAASGRDRALEVARMNGDTPAPSLAALFDGHWSGTLDYRDFAGDRRVVLPTSALGTAAARGAAVLALSFDDGPGKTVRSSQRWETRAGGQLRIRDGDDEELLTLVESRGGPDAREATLVAEGRGVEDGVAVAVRVVVTRRADRLSISRATARAGEPFLLRHVYLLTRQP